MRAHQHRNGGARISTTPWAVAQIPATPDSRSRTAVSAGLVTSFLVLLCGAALATAAPAAAVEDATRPAARVTHGPSCRPGGLVVEVVAGSSPYSVRLATTRTPSGEDEAILRAGETVVLSTADVAYGETIDGRLEFAAQDGSGVTYVDELLEYSFTRPTQEDCDAIAAPSSTAPAPTGSVTTSAPEATSGGAAPTESEVGPSAPPTDVPVADAAGPRSVAVGDTVTLQASGFRPGERVVIQLRGSNDVLGSATAGPDGAVVIDIRVPDGTAGAATMHMTGADSETVAAVALRVAGAETLIDGARTDLVPLTAAAVALVATVGGFFAVAGRARTRRPTIRSI